MEKTVAKLKKPSKNLTDRLMFTKCTDLVSIARFYIDIIHLAPTHCKYRPPNAIKNNIP